MKTMNKVLIAVLFGVGVVSAALISTLIHEDNFSCPNDAKYCKVLIEKNGKKFRSFYITKGDYDVSVYAFYKSTTTTTSITTTTTTTSTTISTTTTTSTTSSTTTTIQGGVGIGCARITGCNYCSLEIECPSHCTDVENGCIDCFV